MDDAVRNPTWRFLRWPAVLVLAACSSGEPEQGLGHTRQAIIGGSASDATQDSVVMLVFSDPATNRLDICTAALVAPRLVLTARHCVADTDLDVKCKEDGSAVFGGVVRATHDAKKLYVFTGPDRPNLDPARWKPSGRGVEVIDDGSKNLCDHDIALVLLEQPVAGARLAPLRLDGSADRDERLTTVGWGITATELEPAHRLQRSGVVVTRVGPDMVDPALTPSEFAFDESICLGDSGGPIFSEKTGAILGVVSRGGNGTSSDTDLAASCIKPTNLGTKLSSFRDLFTRAFMKAQAEPQLEIGRPAPPADDGGCAVAGTDRSRAGADRGLGSVLLFVLVALGLARKTSPQTVRSSRATASRTSSPRGTCTTRSRVGTSRSH